MIKITVLLCFLIFVISYIQSYFPPERSKKILGLIVAVIGGTFIEKMHMEKYVEEFIRNASGVDIESPDLTVNERLIYAKDQVVSIFITCEGSTAWDNFKFYDGGHNA